MKRLKLRAGSVTLRVPMSMRIAAIIPCYRVKEHILSVVAQCGPLFDRIYVVDDCCPDRSGAFVRERCNDPRVTVLTHPTNLGVGGAMVSGYKAALQDGCEVLVKIDGDGQMDPALVPQLIAPIIQGNADYTKGNRFFSLDFLSAMPPVRVFGNAVLSFVNKMTSGYWHLMDPNNGFTAVHAKVLRLVPLDKLDRRFFFESDMLFRLNVVRAAVTEIPMHAVYAQEKSNLKIGKIVRDFPPRYISRFFKRIFYNYFLRDFNVCSLQLLVGSALLAFGIGFGLYHWYAASIDRVFASTGTVMLAALPIILGFQLLLSSIAFDTQNYPRNALYPLLPEPQLPDSSSSFS